MNVLSKDGLAGLSLGLGAVTGAFNWEVLFFLYGCLGSGMIILIGYAIAKLESEQQTALRERLGVRHDYQVKLMSGTLKQLPRQRISKAEDSLWTKK